MKNIFLVGDSIRFGAPNPSKYNNISPGYERYVREKLEGISPNWGLKTVWGVGYKFEVINL